MKLLEQKNWWIWLLAFLFGNTVSTFMLGALLDVYDKNAWYANKRNWILGALFFIFPVFIMFAIFTIQITCEVANKLGVKGSEYYMSPFVWLLLMIIPIIGWTLLSVMALYLNIWTILALHSGAGEKYSK